jgi:hypothetical protein
VAALLEDKRHGRTGRLSARLAVTVGVLATLAANIASAQPTWTARLVAVAASVSFLLSVEVLTRTGRPAKHPNPATDTATATATAAGHASNGHAGHTNGQPGSGQASGGHAGDGRADSGHPGNGQVRPASTRTRTSTSAGRTPRRTSAAAILAQRPDTTAADLARMTGLSPRHARRLVNQHRHPATT